MCQDCPRCHCRFFSVKIDCILKAGLCRYFQICYAGPHDSLDFYAPDWVLLTMQKKKKGRVQIMYFINERWYNQSNWEVCIRPESHNVGVYISPTFIFFIYLWYQCWLTSEIWIYYFINYSFWQKILPDYTKLSRQIASLEALEELHFLILI